MMVMKKKELEILLQKVPSPDSPVPHLEQYMTPADIAADIIFTAHQFGDIQNKTVVDLGCGTGIFSIGAKLTGAKKVIGIDIDKNSIKTAREFAEKNSLDIEFITQDIKNIMIRCDTAIMNPPFGAQKSNRKADSTFIEKGLEIAHVVYSLHLKKTISFIKKLVSSMEGDITYYKDYKFPIRWMFDFHRKKIAKYEVQLLRIKTKNPKINIIEGL
ncbi:MAG: RNA methyltransferase [Thermoplasmata archaeon]|nr:MAG: RNA methyltransferase [Thermoplasmata archaeon]